MAEQKEAFYRREVMASLVAAAIVASIVQTFFESYAGLAGWDGLSRAALMFSGAALDLVFTIELAGRLYPALARGQAGRYLSRGGGWADAAGSAAVVVLSSGPLVLAYGAGGPAVGGPATGAAAAAALLSASRIVPAARLLRLLRLARLPDLLALPAGGAAAATATVVVVGFLWAAVGPTIPGCGSQPACLELFLTVLVAALTATAFVSRAAPPAAQPGQG